MQHTLFFCTADEFGPIENLTIKGLTADVPNESLLAGDELVVDMQRKPEPGSLAWFIHSDGLHSIARYQPVYETAYSLAAVHPILARIRHDGILPDVPLPTSN